MTNLNSVTPQYAGFWRRLLAMLVELIVWAPLGFIIAKWGWSSHFGVIVSSMFGQFLGLVYNFYFMKRWGQTIGKMVAGIKVVAVELSPVKWSHIILRYSVDLIFGILMAIASDIALLRVPDTELATLGFMELAKRLHENTPASFFWLKPMQQIWFWSELVVLLLNKKKRALHDYLAGTVVIKT